MEKTFKNVIVHCAKSSTSQIGFYAIRIRNAQDFHRKIGEVAIHEDFPLKNSLIKKAFSRQFDKIRKFLSCIDFFDEIKRF